MSSAEYKSFIEAIPQEDIGQAIHLLTLRQQRTTYFPLVDDYHSDDDEDDADYSNDETPHLYCNKTHRQESCNDPRCLNRKGKSCFYLCVDCPCIKRANIYDKLKAEAAKWESDGNRVKYERCLKICDEYKTKHKQANWTKWK